jgi:hypothetical protein
MEIATLSKASGAEPLLSLIEEESRKRGVALHWGQRNNRVQTDIEKEFGAINKWRDGLSDLSEHGRLANLSTQFTKIKGLEITVPLLYQLTTSLSDGCANEMTTVSYDAWKNPPETTLKLIQTFTSGAVNSIDLPDLRGTIDIPLGPGRSTLELHATRVLNGILFKATPLQTSVHGFRKDEVWQFEFEAELRVIGGIQRWYVEINLWSMFISNMLRVSQVALDGTSVADWIMRNADTGDVNFAGFSDSKLLPSLPVFNTNWKFFTVSLAAAVSPPTLKIGFTISC